METKQHDSKQKINQKENQTRDQNYLETNENGNTFFQNMWMQQKQF